jgi:hypothetical protein
MEVTMEYAFLGLVIALLFLCSSLWGFWNRVRDLNIRLEDAESTNSRQRRNFQELLRLFSITPKVMEDKVFELVRELVELRDELGGEKESEVLPKIQELEERIRRILTLAPACGIHIQYTFHGAVSQVEFRSRRRLSYAYEPPSPPYTPYND